MSTPTADLAHHGDAEVAAGWLDFAVNVRAASPPQWLRDRLAARLADLGAYPAASEEQAVRRAVARRHQRDESEVLLLAGVAEGFALLPNLGSALAAVVVPSFTEPELMLRRAGVAIHHVVTPPGAPLDVSAVPARADLVVIGNPTNPTGTLHPARLLTALRAPGRVIVVDEAFMDVVPGERESVAALGDPQLLVFRSLTKTWSLAGLRVGYVLGDPPLLKRLAATRPHWPLGTLQWEAIAACMQPNAVAEAQREATRIVEHRDYLVERLRGAGLDPYPSCAPFVLCPLPDAARIREALRGKQVAVRRGDTFAALHPDHVRIAVREPQHTDLLLDALTEAL